MKAEQFCERASDLIQELIKLTNASLLNDGDTAETSQRICVLESLNSAQAAINGVTDSDMKS